MDTFGRLPNDVLFLIKDLYETPTFSFEYQEDDNFHTKIFLVVQVNTTITKFIMFNTYEPWHSIELQIYDDYNKNKRDILVILNNLIDKIAEGEDFEMTICIKFKIIENKLILQHEYYEMILQNTDDCRQSLINALCECYDQIYYDY